jgi:trans-2,3-dihydro-3-hydroxyanthranilate isomerase
MRSYRYLHLDVFTDHLFGGNQLAVFLDGRGLATDEMQAIAKEMNFSESTFVFPAEDPDTDMRVRIFTPHDELPMAGHPTIGTTFALARSGALTPERKRVVFGLGVGPTPVSLTWKNRALTFAWMTQRAPSFGGVIADRATAAAALSLPASAITSTGLPVQVVSCGVPFLFVPVATRRAVDNAAVDRAALTALLQSADGGAHGVFVFSPERGRDKSDRATVYSRMFAPDLGVAEDPATGGASGPLGCYLVKHKVVPADKADAMVSLQGVKMGRPSHIHIAIGLDGREFASVRVGGEAVVAGEGTLYV